jgi:glycosyltransferase involved in cell wall biosynthesis
LRPTGIDRVCLAYLDHFGADAQAVVQHRRFRRILDRRASAALFKLLKEPSPRFRAAMAAGALRNLGRFNCAGRGRLYLNIGHTGLDSDGFTKWVGDADVRPVYFVHDLIPITNPEYCRKGEDDRHRERMRTVLRTGAGVVANSQATLDELGHFARQQRLPQPPAVAAWLGCSLEKAETKAMQTSPATFVTLGTIEARKNHLLLLDVWSKLVPELGPRAPRLLIIGRRGWEADEVFRHLDGNASGHVVELNGCSDDELSRHLASAAALLFPSNAEGFGLPLVEALTAGIPVIASDLPIFREIGQGVPLLIDPGDPDAWEAAILDFAQPSSAGRARQQQAMARFRPPTWDDHFRLVERWLSGPFSTPADPTSNR